jgi:hypothetical protein
MMERLMSLLLVGLYGWLGWLSPLLLRGFCIDFSLKGSVVDDDDDDDKEEEELYVSKETVGIYRSLPKPDFRHKSSEATLQPDTHHHPQRVRKNTYIPCPRSIQSSSSNV